jgi:DNA-directed RNA polymerase III subunit RPC8
MVVFRPFKGEIIQGILLEGNPEGIRVHLDFFSDIWIPAANLQEGSRL